MLQIGNYAKNHDLRHDISNGNLPARLKLGFRMRSNENLDDDVLDVDPYDGISPRKITSPMINKDDPYEKIEREFSQKSIVRERISKSQSSRKFYC